MTTPRLRVGFILAPRFTLTAFSCFVDVLRLSADEGDKSRQILCQWEILSPDLSAVMSSCGVTVRPDQKLGDPARFDYLVIVGGLLDEDIKLDPRFEAYLKAAAKLHIPLVGLCTGGFVLHKLGLMDGYKSCVSWFHHDDFLHRFDGLTPISDQIFVEDRDRLTSSGGISSAHLAAHLVEKHIGLAQARKSLRIMIIDEAMTGSKAQPGIPLELVCDDEIVRRALLLMQQNMENPLSMDRLARRLEIGKRKLERHFKKALDITPSHADKKIRIDHAKERLKQGKRSVAQVAQDVGFCDASHFIKVFKELNGMTPSAYRDL